MNSTVETVFMFIGILSAIYFVVRVIIIVTDFVSEMNNLKLKVKDNDRSMWSEFVRISNRLEVLEKEKT